MKTCPQCNYKVHDWIAACPKCRHLFAQAQRPGTLGNSQTQGDRAGGIASSPRAAPPGAGHRPAAGHPRSGQAARVDVLALIAPFMALFCGGILGVPLGVVALKRIDASGGALKGRGLALAGIFLGVIIFAVTIMLPILMVLLED